MHCSEQITQQQSVPKDSFPKMCVIVCMGSKQFSGANKPVPFKHLHTELFVNLLHLGNWNTIDGSHCTDQRTRTHSTHIVEQLIDSALAQLLQTPHNADCHHAPVNTIHTQLPIQKLLDVMEPAKICFRRIRILYFKSVGFACRFVTQSQLPRLS